MKDTGRIKETLTPTAERIVYRERSGEREMELAAIARVDCAHLIMLAKTGLVREERVRALLRVISDLEKTEFNELKTRATPRGVYLMYEDYLRETLGDDVGGSLQTARSRNDLNATVLRLKLRTPFLRLLRAVLLLQAVVISRGTRFAEVVMPIYTHYQPALPSTYGHYLAGIATALQRDAEGLFDATRDLGTSPLGVGAAGGNTLPIDTSLTAALLGFDRTATNSLDAVASRDPVVRLLASSTILGLTLSRLATDLLLWLSQEYGFLALPDCLVGSSSMMPQKRNPFLLEIVQGRAASPLGAFVTAVTAAHKTPFTNSIAAGSEAVRPAWQALEDIIDAVTLARLVVAGAMPQRDVMYRRAQESHTVATEVANQLVSQSGFSFRTAHHAVGALVRSAIETNQADLLEGARQLVGKEFEISPDSLNPASVVNRANYGGGPGPRSLRETLKLSRASWIEGRSAFRGLDRKWRSADEELTRTVNAMCGVGD